MCTLWFHYDKITSHEVWKWQFVRVYPLKWVYLIIHPSGVSVACRMTGVARGPCRGSGLPSSRPEWCAQSQSTSCTSTSCAVCLSCRVETLKAAFSMASSAWNGKRNNIFADNCTFGLWANEHEVCHHKDSSNIQLSWHVYRYFSVIIIECQTHWGIFMHEWRWFLRITKFEFCWRGDDRSNWTLDPYVIGTPWLFYTCTLFFSTRFANMAAGVYTFSATWALMKSSTDVYQSGPAHSQCSRQCCVGYSSSTSLSLWIKA